MDKPIFIIDTNVLLRFILNDDAKQHAKVKKYFISNELFLYLPIMTVCETIWVIKDKMKIPRQSVIQILTALVEQDNILIATEAFDYGMNFLKSGGDFADGVIAYQAHCHDNATLLTFDKKSQKIAKQLAITCIEP
ncbi:PIN domain-containing protein [Psychrobacter sp. I-STPA10]|uniref:PIN domain-containing protein n=1 Tax=Psychrobacter sp. I-STPA10 TaxID=2585769 RepID=UPI001E2A5F37|nr:type II toxin-antitoxin system VapC family toxin [Psychrobacter sp. I-STPA10]